MIKAVQDEKGVTTMMVGPGEVVATEFHAIMMNFVKILRKQGATDPEIEQMLVKSIVTAFDGLEMEEQLKKGKE